MSPIRYLILATVLLLGIGASFAIGRLGHPFAAAGFRPLKLPFSAFPERLGDWKGRDRPLDPATLEIAGLDRYLRRSYVRSDGAAVLFYICYYGNKERGLRSIYHNPTICFPAAGWEWSRSAQRTVTLPDAARQLDVSLDLFTMPGKSLVVLNFFVIDGEVLEKPPRNKPFWLALEKLRASPDPGYFAQVQVVSEVKGDEKEAETIAIRFLESAGRSIFLHF